MKNKFMTFMALAAAGLFMSNCALTLPVNATSNAVGSKVGTAKASGYFGIIYMNQDASIAKAAKNGGITKISTVDLKQTSLFNLITTYECIVTGE
jgi:hypothetical protein